MIRLLHISDVHLGAPLSGFGAAAAERRLSVREAFRRLPARAAEWSVDAVVVAGDLFDCASPDRADVDVAREVLRQLADEGRRPVVAIPGNHDSAVSPDSPWHSMPESVTTVVAPRFGPPVTVEAGGEALHVHAVAFDPALEPAPLAGFRRGDLDGVHVALVHASAVDNPDWTGGRGLRITTADLERIEADYIALGDHHAFRAPEDFAGAPACYPGSFAAVAVDEVGPRGCVVVDLEPGAPPRVRHEGSGVPALVDLGMIDVSDHADELEVADRVGSLMPVGAPGYPVAVVAGEPSFPLDAARVREALIERFGFAVIADRTRFIDSAHVAALAARPTIAGHVARLGRARVETVRGTAEEAIAERALRLALRAMEAG
ncbi:MAG: metallophosphoesterase family protein [Gemmatimonadota bacterium]